MKSKQRKEDVAKLEQRLKEYRRQGTRITLEGEEYSISKIAQACMAEEEGTYMGDYVFDDSGKLVEIRFDKISLPEK